MDEEILETFDGKINVEISVSTGGVSAVSFTTVIKIDPENKKLAQQKLRDVSSLLRAALPFTELKSEELEFNNKQTVPAGVTANGPITKQEAITISAQKVAEACKPETKQ